MCLDQKLEVPKEKLNGFFIKKVRTTEKPDEFTPIWSRFHMGGQGGTFNSNKKHTRATRTVYKIGRKYRVRHKYMATATMTKESYPAGVHGWHSVVQVATGIGQVILNEDEAFVLFSYKKAVARDFHTLVAMEVTPVAIIPQRILKSERKWSKMSMEDLLNIVKEANKWPDL